MRTIVAGGPAEFMTVNHLEITGSQAEIGRVLATEAANHYGWRPVPADPRISRARRAWFRRHWPQHHARMTGAAEAVGVDLDEFHVDGLSGVPQGSACSAVWCAPVGGHGLLGRNYDFFTVGWEQMFALMSGRPGPEHETPLCARPFVITSVPDDGPATTVITMNELDGCMEGINEHGLAVALLIADAETAGEPVQAGPQVGISSVQLPRFVLDTCATADEAQQALLAAKQYDLGTPLHYLVADATGRAFVWEHTSGGVEHIVEADGEALCVTNHLLHKPTDPANPPRDDEETMFTHRRLATLTERTKAGPMSAAGLRAALDEVRCDAERAGSYPLRTLWRTVFDLEDRTMSTRFYLGDTPGGDLRYSEESVFRAQPRGATNPDS